LKQILDKIFKPEIKPDPNINRPKRVALCGHCRNSRRRPEEISEFIDLYLDKCDQYDVETKPYEKGFDSMW